MFQSAEQATNYFTAVAFYNRHIGEFVVMTAFYYEKIASFF